MTEPFPQPLPDSELSFQRSAPSESLATLRPWQSVPSHSPSAPLTPADQPVPVLPRSMSTTTAKQPNLACRRRKGTISAPFAGRIGGNQEFTLDRSDPNNEELLKKVPDAAPNLTLEEAFDLRGFTEIGLYKASLIEFMGECFPTPGHCGQQLYVRIGHK